VCVCVCVFVSLSVSLVHEHFPVCGGFVVCCSVTVVALALHTLT